MSSRLNHARYEVRADGYCRWRSYELGPGEPRERYVFTHRLLATLLEEVEDLEDLDGQQVHHRMHVDGLPALRSLNVIELSIEIPELEEGPLLELHDEESHGSYHLQGRELTQEGSA